MGEVRIHTDVLVVLNGFPLFVIWFCAPIRTAHSLRELLLVQYHRGSNSFPIFILVNRIITGFCVGIFDVIISLVGCCEVLHLIGHHYDVLIGYEGIGLTWFVVASCWLWMEVLISHGVCIPDLSCVFQSWLLCHVCHTVHWEVTTCFTHDWLSKLEAFILLLAFAPIASLWPIAIFAWPWARSAQHWNLSSDCILIYIEYLSHRRHPSLLERHLINWPAKFLVSKVRTSILRLHVEGIQIIKAQIECSFFPARIVRRCAIPDMVETKPKLLWSCNIVLELLWGCDWHHWLHIDEVCHESQVFLWYFIQLSLSLGYIHWLSGPWALFGGNWSVWNCRSLQPLVWALMREWFSRLEGRFSLEHGYFTSCATLVDNSPGLDGVLLRLDEESGKGRIDHAIVVNLYFGFIHVVLRSNLLRTCLRFLYSIWWAKACRTVTNALWRQLHLHCAACWLLLR